MKFIFATLVAFSLSAVGRNPTIVNNNNDDYYDDNNDDYTESIVKKIWSVNGKR